MKRSTLPKERADIQVYTPPVCKVFFVEPRKIICASETETVGEVEGQW